MKATEHRLNLSLTRNVSVPVA